MTDLPLSRIEFYERGKGMIEACRGSVAPRAGEYVNIAKEQWKVVYVSWAVDQAPSGAKEIRANVECEKAPNDEVGPANN